MTSHYPNLEPFAKNGTKFLYVSFRLPIADKIKQFQKSTGETDLHAARKAAVKIYDDTRAKIFNDEQSDQRAQEASNALDATIPAGERITLLSATSAFLAYKYLDVSPDTLNLYRVFIRRMLGTRTNKQKQVETLTPLIDPAHYLHEITQDHINKFISTLQKDFTHDAFRANVSRLSSFLEFCEMEERHATVSKEQYAMSTFRLPKKSHRVNGKKYGQAPKVRQRLFTIEQRNELIAILERSKSKDNATLVTMLAFLPIRIGEACRTLTSDIDLDNRTIYIRRLKGSHDGTAPLCDRLYNAIVQQQARTGPSKFLFPADSATGHKSKEASQWWTRAMDAMSDRPNDPETVRRDHGGEKLTPHSLRHTVATGLAATMTDSNLTKLFGHKSERQTAAYIKRAKSHPEIDAQALAILNAMQ